ncbi:MAG: efflux RND transporter permease subunit, partial [Bacteroidales bacterium]|nr:efflux RND transporter permease subunit [Bacteroidales bacterium]
MRLPPFSVILLFVVLVIAGMGITPLLNIQYSPTVRQKNFSVGFSWPGASAKVIESEVTSKLEGVISSVSGVKSVSSVSSKGNGRIAVELKSKSDIDAVRYEIASLIRRIYPKLPEGVSYPAIGLAATGTKSYPVMTYKVNSSLPVNSIREYTESVIKKELSLIKGVDRIVIKGAEPYIIEVVFDPDILDNMGITPGEIQSAIGTNTGLKTIIGSAEGMTVWLEPGSSYLSSSSDLNNLKLGMMPVKYYGNRVIRLDDVADIVVREPVPETYYRINGLNTINFVIYPEPGVNTITLCDQIKVRVKELSKAFPRNFSATVDQDESVRLKEELGKIFRRIIFSVLFLLAFVVIITRSARYLVLITFTLIANIFIAFIFYYLLKVQIHFYALAGITVSLGMIIDSSIIMISHYGYFRDRKAFLAILAALLTTIGALSVIFFLPERIKMDLGDFAAVIIINLSVSLAISLLLVPALIDTWPVKGVTSQVSIASKRRTVRFNHIYARYISFGRNHRWLILTLLILGFGLPVFQLPNKIREEKNQFHRIYNKTIGTDFYNNKLRKIVNVALGGSMRLFYSSARLQYYRGGGDGDVLRPQIFVEASLPDGCTVHQLNEVIVHMENFLAGFPQVERFVTTVSSNRSSSIIINFKKEYEKSGFPHMLKQELIAKAIVFGGASWSVSMPGDMDNFSNNIYSSGTKSNRIELTGYNYDMLYAFCEDAVKSLSKNARVNDPGIYGGTGGGRMVLNNEYYIEFDQEKLLKLGITPDKAYYVLSKQMYDQRAGSFSLNEEKVQIKLVSSKKESFDIWNFENEYLDLGTGHIIRIPEIGHVEIRKSGNDIHKKDQQYILTVGFDFIGSYQLAGKIIKNEVDRLNSQVLPVGFRAGKDTRYEPLGGVNSFLLIIVVAIIYFICAILFESLLQPLYIILLIPVSFTGLFLTFCLTGFRFD